MSGERYRLISNIKKLTQNTILINGIIIRCLLNPLTMLIASDILYLVTLHSHLEIFKNCFTVQCLKIL
jgi:hypothetical protein